jgi:cell division protein FtsN
VTQPSILSAFSAPSSRQAGSTVIGFLIGLVCGLAVAVAVAIFVTKAPIPFVNKAAKPSERILEPKSGAEMPDPNKTLQSKAGRPAQTDTGVPAPAADGSNAAGKDEKKDSILGLLGSIGGATGDSKGDGKAAAPDPKPADPKPAEIKPAAPGKTADAKPAEGGKASYQLQVGSFVSNADAESRKIKLALAGFEAKVVQAEVDGKTVYRVRTGPYKDFDDMNKARSKLTEGGFDVSIARQ